MRYLLIVAPLMSACASSSVSDSVLCDRLEGPLKTHAEALLEDGGPKSKETAVPVVKVYQGGCDG